MKRPTIYIFINKSLNMSVGKIAAQAAHSMAPIKGLAGKNYWLRPHRTIMIMEARDQQHMANIQQYLADRYIETFVVIDEGANEVDAQVATAMSTEIVDKDLEDIQTTFSTFKVYREKVKVTLEIDK